jgi:hypothetical protein
VTRGSSSNIRAIHRVAKANEVQGVGARSEASDNGGDEDPSAAAQEQYLSRELDMLDKAAKAVVETTASGKVLDGLAAQLKASLGQFRA